MQQISIDFEVFKALTARRVHEQHSYNDVVRELLGLDSFVEPPEAIEGLIDNSGPVRDGRFGRGSLLDGALGFSARGIFLPNGTLLKATYKGRHYAAKIEHGNWLDPDGQSQSSPSAAAKSITGSNVNGLRFWQARRPDDQSWFRLDLLR